MIPWPVVVVTTQSVATPSCAPDPLAVRNVVRDSLARGNVVLAMCKTVVDFFVCEGEVSHPAIHVARTELFAEAPSASKIYGSRLSLQ